MGGVVPALTALAAAHAASGFGGMGSKSSTAWKSTTLVLAAAVPKLVSCSVSCVVLGACSVWKGLLPLISTGAAAAVGQLEAPHVKASIEGGGTGEVRSILVRDRQRRLVALRGDPAGSQIWTTTCTVRMLIALPIGALKLGRVDTSDAASVSAKGAHQRVLRSADEGQSRVSSEHALAPRLQAMKKNW